MHSTRSHHSNYVRGYLKDHRLKLKDNSSDVAKCSQETKRRVGLSINRQQTMQRGPKKYSIENLPEEILLRIFLFLPLPDLLANSRVCVRWQQLSNDNVLWQRIYRTLLQHHRGENAPCVPRHIPPMFWRSLCMESDHRSRQAAALKLLRKTSPFTGLTKSTQETLQQLDVRWYICYRDSHGAETFIRNDDAFYFSMSVCARWYSSVLPPFGSMQQLRLYAARPVLFGADGRSVVNSPCQRSLLCDLEVNRSSLHSLTTLETDTIQLQITDTTNGLIFATWKDSGDLAFITVNFHVHQFVRRCLLGTSTIPFKIPVHKVVSDDIDAKYGLHGYSCTLELRSQRQSLWSEQFRTLDCSGEFIDGRAVFILIDPEKVYQRSWIKNKILLPWKTVALRGKIQNICIMDLTLLDEHKSPMWCISEAVKLSNPHHTHVDYDYEGEELRMDFSESRGRVQMTLIWQEDSRAYVMTSLQVHVSLHFINQWFATEH